MCLCEYVEFPPTRLPCVASPLTFIPYELFACVRVCLCVVLCVSVYVCVSADALPLALSLSACAYVCA